MPVTTSWIGLAIFIGVCRGADGIWVIASHPRATTGPGRLSPV